ncbi:hypothetical protein MY11210_007012 [Beauveria gryllotalpidicola]
MARSPKFARQQTVGRLPGEKLSLTLVPSIHGNQQNSSAVDGKERTDRIKFMREDLENDERKRELAKRCPHVRAFESPLRCTNLN